MTLKGVLKKIFFRLITLTLCTVILTPAPSFASAPRPDRKVFVHLFEWKWSDVAIECEKFLGPKGFAAVQVSPPNEHALLPGHPWYQRYQPVSYQLISRSGTRAEFADMVKRCKASNVDVYVDAVINHMTWVNRSGSTKYGSAKSPYDEYLYPGTYQPWDFHRCGRNGDDSIANYHDRWEVQNCNVTTCADLNTGAEYVRTRLASYLNDLLSLGVAGFRIDAAKHMHFADLQAILGRLNKGAYIFQEVIDFGYEPIKSDEYFPTGDVTEFRYSRNLARIFYNGKLSWLNSFGQDWNFIPASKAVVFVDNHDIQRGHGGGGEVITHKDPETYILATTFMLAWPYGYPQVMSSYSFQDPSQGPPNHEGGKTKPVYDNNVLQCGKEWQCEHRWEPISNMVMFRNVTSETSINNWWSNGNNQIAFGRGNKGFVAINKEDKPMNHVLQTEMPAGNYCDVISGSVKRQECTGQIVTVTSSGKVDLKVGARRAIAIHIGSRI